MLPVGSVDNPVQLTELNNTGYDAVKAVFRGESNCSS